MSMRYWNRRRSMKMHQKYNSQEAECIGRGNYIDILSGWWKIH